MRSRLVSGRIPMLLPGCIRASDSRKTDRRQVCGPLRVMSDNCRRELNGIEDQGPIETRIKRKTVPVIELRDLREGMDVALSHADRTEARTG